MWRVSSFLVAFLFGFIAMGTAAPARTASKLYKKTTSNGKHLLKTALPKARVTFQPQTFEVKGRAGFETRLQRLAFLRVFHLPNAEPKSPSTARVNWGDGTRKDRGLLKCKGLPTPNQCYVYGTHVYQKPGTYTIKIRYKLGGPEHPLHPWRTAVTHARISSVPPGNFVILTIGDSVASGEGNPVLPFKIDSGMRNGGYWDDPGSDYHRTSLGGCHRSIRAGFAMAAKKVQANNPGITRVSFACSGDTVNQAISGFKEARENLKRIDVLLISVGADDIDGGFSHLIQDCIPLVNHKASSCYNDPKFVKRITDDVEQKIPQSYNALAEEIGCLHSDSDAGHSEPRGCSELQVPKLVLITEYFDPTHDAKGHFPTPLEDPLCAVAATALNMEWLYSHIEVPLNQHVDRFPQIARNAGLTIPTYVVKGLPEKFLKHGYCAGSDRWVDNILDSTLVQNSVNGAGHPNKEGQAQYRKSIYNAIVKYNPPVVTASATKAGGVDPSAYEFGTRTNKSVTVSLSKPTNAILKAGVGPTYYAVDDPGCTSTSLGRKKCKTYSGPFMIDSPGRHTVTFFGTNGQGYPERVQNVQVLIDKNGT